MNKEKKTPYFGKAVQDAIIRYNEIENPVEKEKLFKTLIYPAFDKLSEVLIHTFKFYYIDDSVQRIKNTTVAFLVQKIGKYDESKGKAYSYFTIVARNYLIMENKKEYKKILEKRNMDSIELVNIPYSYDLDNERKAVYFDTVIDYFQSNLDELFAKQRDLEIANAILMILKRRESFDNFNKKALYILIKEITNCKSQYITTVINKIKNHYKNINSNIYDKVNDVDVW